MWIRGTTVVGSGGQVKVDAKFGARYRFNFEHVSHHVQDLIQVNGKLCFLIGL